MEEGSEARADRAFLSQSFSTTGLFFKVYKCTSSTKVKNTLKKSGFFVDSFHHQVIFNYNNNKSVLDDGSLR